MVAALRVVFRSRSVPVPGAASRATVGVVLPAPLMAVLMVRG
jgi:hypothetical protein